MSKVISKSVFGWGHSNRADAFQAGREAAQAAKSQVAEEVCDLAIVMAKPSIHFQNYVEGARLVTGEEKLLGLPCQHIESSDAPAAEGCCVLLLKSRCSNLSIALVDSQQDRPSAVATSILTQFRMSRGLKRENYSERGLIIFNYWHSQDQPFLSPLIEADVGLDSWIVELIPTEIMSPVFVGSQVLSNPIVALECLSNEQWGIGSVSVASFGGNRTIYLDAIRSAIRDALVQMSKTTVLFGIIAIDRRSFSAETGDMQPFLNECRRNLKDIPLFLMLTGGQALKSCGRGLVSGLESVTAVLVPAP